MDDDIKALREEVAKLKERVAILEADTRQAVGPFFHVPLIDWTKPIRVGSPVFVKTGELPPGTITC